MEYIRKKISLENYTIRSIPKSILITNAEGKTIIDENSPKYFYGKIPDYRVDTNGDYELDAFGQKILNTINIDLLPNLGELKNQILAEARSSLVDQAPRQYSLVRHFLSPS